jgi:hypothetical protein
MPNPPDSATRCKGGAGQTGVPQWSDTGRAFAEREKRRNDPALVRQMTPGVSKVVHYVCHAGLWSSGVQSLEELDHGFEPCPHELRPRHPSKQVFNVVVAEGQCVIALDLSEASKPV